MKKILFFLFVAFLFVLVAIKRCYEMAGPLPQEAFVIIPKGANSRIVAQKLFESGVISRPFLFRLAARFKGLDKRLKAGEYQFEPHVSMAQVLNQINEGDIYYRKMTLPEGLMSSQIVELINENPMLAGEIVELPEEGSILPETYTYKFGDSKQDVLMDAQSSLDKVLAFEWKNRNPDVPLKSPEELLILASIIEKETGVPEERGLVSSVFVNRLRKGMKLQTDPTVIYALTQGKEELGRSLRRKDLSIDSPYNTYKYFGLPPTPICNPGKESIHAAAHPEESDFLFFVADGKGGHNFSTTLKEHNKNVKDWVKSLPKKKK